MVLFILAGYAHSLIYFKNVPNIKIVINSSPHLCNKSTDVRIFLWTSACLLWPGMMGFWL